MFQSTVTQFIHDQYILPYLIVTGIGILTYPAFIPKATLVSLVFVFVRSPNHRPLLVLAITL